MSVVMVYPIAPAQSLRVPGRRRKAELRGARAGLVAGLVQPVSGRTAIRPLGVSCQTSLPSMTTADMALP